MIDESEVIKEAGIRRKERSERMAFSTFAHEIIPGSGIKNRGIVDIKGSPGLRIAV